MTFSARNQLEETVDEVRLGGMIDHIAVRVGNNFNESAITHRSAGQMARVREACACPRKRLGAYLPSHARNSAGYLVQIMPT